VSAPSRAHRRKGEQAAVEAGAELPTPLGAAGEHVCQECDVGAALAAGARRGRGPRRRRRCRGGRGRRAWRARRQVALQPGQLLRRQVFCQRPQCAARQRLRSGTMTVLSMCAADQRARSCCGAGHTRARGSPECAPGAG